MKIINAIIIKDLYEDFAENLAAIGVVGITATSCVDTDIQGRKLNGYANSDQKLNFDLLMELEIVVHDDRVDDVVELLESVVTSSQFDTGKIIIKEMDDAIRIRDGQHGDDAL